VSEEAEALAHEVGVQVGQLVAVALLTSEGDATGAIAGLELHGASPAIRHQRDVLRRDGIDIIEIAQQAIHDIDLAIEAARS
jgi:hypothetical protein